MRALAAAVALALLPTGCGGGGLDTRLRLVVRDNNIREEGIECAGARPFRHVHKGTAWAVEGPDGTVLADGELPAGRSVNADPSVDWGVERIPTVCVFELDLELEERPRYRFVVEGSRPIPFDRALAEADEPLTLVLGG